MTTLLEALALLALLPLHHVIVGRLGGPPLWQPPSPKAPPPPLDPFKEGEP